MKFLILLTLLLGGQAFADHTCLVRLTDAQPTKVVYAARIFNMKHGSFGGNGGDTLLKKEDFKINVGTRANGWDNNLEAVAKLEDPWKNPWTEVYISYTDGPTKLSYQKKIERNGSETILLPNKMEVLIDCHDRQTQKSFQFGDIRDFVGQFANLSRSEICENELLDISYDGTVDTLLVEELSSKGSEQKKWPLSGSFAIATPKKGMVVYSTNADQSEIMEVIKKKKSKEYQPTGNSTRMKLELLRPPKGVWGTIHVTADMQDLLVITHEVKGKKSECIYKRF
ncbi:MAG: hypothetical protein H6620_06370 [Halobacteriovoraceae bacterium]|nr:hypothetical protein [Halobacteriovoraceae bacterium]